MTRVIHACTIEQGDTCHNSHGEVREAQQNNYFSNISYLSIVKYKQETTASQDKSKCRIDIEN